MERDHRKIFDAAASQYATDRYPGRGQCARLVLDFLAPQSDDVILDVGCGPGEQLISLAPIINQGFGIDISENMIKRASAASSRLTNLHFCLGSADGVPAKLKEVSYTGIYSNYALHHLSTARKAEAITMLAGLLAPGGRLVIGDLMFSEDPGKHQNLFAYTAYDPESDTPSSVAELEEIFAAAGLSFTTRLLNPLVGLIIGRKDSKSASKISPCGKPLCT